MGDGGVHFFGMGLTRGPRRKARGFRWVSLKLGVWFSEGTLLGVF